MDTTTLLIIILIVVLLGGGGWYGRGRWFWRAPSCANLSIHSERKEKRLSRHAHLLATRSLPPMRRCHAPLSDRTAGKG